MSAAFPSAPERMAAGPRLSFCNRIADLPPDTLGALVYGLGGAAADDPRLVAVPLAAMPGTHHIEAWPTQGPVSCGSILGLHFSASAEHLFGFMQIDEAAAGGLRLAAREAYRQLLRFHANGDHRRRGGSGALSPVLPRTGRRNHSKCLSCRYRSRTSHWRAPAAAGLAGGPLSRPRRREPAPGERVPLSAAVWSCIAEFLPRDALGRPAADLGHFKHRGP